jgi:fucose permease
VSSDPGLSKSDRTRLAAASAIGFLLLGLGAAILGPALPALRAQYGMTGTGSSFLVSAFWAGSVVGVVAGGFLLPRLPPRYLLSGGFALMAVGGVAISAAPSAVLAGLGIGLYGLGFGILDIGINLTVARAYAGGSGAVLIAVNGCYGIGSIVGPLIVGRTPGDAGTPFLIFAAGAALLVLGTLSVRAESIPTGERLPVDRRIVWILVGFGLLLITYVATETGASAWETTHLLGTTHMSEASAARATSLFWVGMTVGRFAGAPLALRFRPQVLVVGSMVAGGLSLLLATWTSASVVAYGLTGLFFAPMFPTVISWMARAVPSGQGATAVFAFALVGPVVVSPLLGASADHLGAGSIPIALAVLAAVTLGTAVSLSRRLRAAAADPVTSAAATPG